MMTTHHRDVELKAEHAPKNGVCAQKGRVEDDRVHVEDGVFTTDVDTDTKSGVFPKKGRVYTEDGVYAEAKTGIPNNGNRVWSIRRHPGWSIYRGMNSHQPDTTIQDSGIFHFHKLFRLQLNRLGKIKNRVLPPPYFL